MKRGVAARQTEAAGKPGKGRSSKSATDGAHAAYTVPAVAKTIAIIKMLNERGGAGAGLPELSEELDITRSHCFSILRTMVAYGWIEYQAQTRLYHLSSGIAADTSSALVSTAHLATIRPFVAALAEMSGFPANLCEVIADGSFLVVSTASHLDPFVFGVPVGYSFPKTSPHHQKSVLTWLSPGSQAAALDEWTPVRYTPSTITDRAAMEEELRVTRRRGYVRSVGEFVEGFRSLALPIFNRDGNVFLVLSVFGREEQMQPREAEVGRLLIDRAAAIHLAIDGRPPVDFPRPIP